MTAATFFDFTTDAGMLIPNRCNAFAMLCTV
jgi:hypothetical protein